MPAAMMGIMPDHNLFVDAAGRWLAGYLPATWRRGALCVARVEGRDDWVICLDLDSDLISETDGEILFDQDGATSPFVKASAQFLAGLEAARIATERACAALDRQGLLVPWQVTVEKPEGGSHLINGLFRIDEARLAKLDGEALGELHAAQALALAYAHLMSLHKLPLLGRLASDHAAEQQRRAGLQQGKLDLDRAFGIVEDDPFIF